MRGCSASPVDQVTLFNPDGGEKRAILKVRVYFLYVLLCFVLQRLGFDRCSRSTQFCGSPRPAKMATSLASLVQCPKGTRFMIFNLEILEADAAVYLPYYLTFDLNW